MADTKRPTASVSLDVDNLWSYMKVHGNEDWRSRPSYLPGFLPHALGALAELDLRITFFIVGLDAAEDSNGAALRGLAAGGHSLCTPGTRVQQRLADTRSVCHHAEADHEQHRLSLRVE